MVCRVAAPANRACDLSIYSRRATRRRLYRVGFVLVVLALLAPKFEFPAMVQLAGLFAVHMPGQQQAG